jgi:hypothetical protein
MTFFTPYPFSSCRAAAERTNDMTGIFRRCASTAKPVPVAEFPAVTMIPL